MAERLPEENLPLEGSEHHQKTRFDYYPLKGFIYSNKKLKNLRGYAQFLGMKEQNLAVIINNKRRNMFTQEHIYKTMKEFNLTPEQVVQFFFTESDEPESQAQLMNYIFVKMNGNCYHEIHSNKKYHKNITNLLSSILHMDSDYYHVRIDNSNSCL